MIGGAKIQAPGLRYASGSGTKNRWVKAQTSPSPNSANIQYSCQLQSMSSRVDTSPVCVQANSRYCSHGAMHECRYGRPANCAHIIATQHVLAFSSLVSAHREGCVIESSTWAVAAAPRSAVPHTLSATRWRSDGDALMPVDSVTLCSTPASRRRRRGPLSTVGPGRQPDASRGPSIIPWRWSVIGRRGSVGGAAPNVDWPGTVVRCA